MSSRILVGWFHGSAAMPRTAAGMSQSEGGGGGTGVGGGGTGVGGGVGSGSHVAEVATGDAGFAATGDGTGGDGTAGDAVGGCVDGADATPTAFGTPLRLSADGPPASGGDEEEERWAPAAS